MKQELDANLANLDSTHPTTALANHVKTEHIPLNSEQQNVSPATAVVNLHSTEVSVSTVLLVNSLLTLVIVKNVLSESLPPIQEPVPVIFVQQVLKYLPIGLDVSHVHLVNTQTINPLVKTAHQAPSHPTTEQPNVPTAVVDTNQSLVEPIVPSANHLISQQQQETVNYVHLVNLPLLTVPVNVTSAVQVLK